MLLLSVLRSVLGDARASIQDRSETSWTVESSIPATVISLSVQTQKYKARAGGKWGLGSVLDCTADTCC